MSLALFGRFLGFKHVSINFRNFRSSTPVKLIFAFKMFSTTLIGSLSINGVVRKCKY